MKWHSEGTYFPCDVAEIFKIKLAEHETADFVARHYEKTCIFSVQSAYRLALWNFYGAGNVGSSSNSDRGRAGWMKVWQVHVPSKVSVFTMKAVNNGLPTRVNKKYRHLVQQDICQLCGQYAETVPCFGGFSACLGFEIGYEGALGSAFRAGIGQGCFRLDDGDANTH